MTEMELIDRLNPRRELPQVICDAISKTWEVMNKENEQLVKYCKELEAGFLNYKKNYKTKRQKVFDLETRVRNFEKENEQLKQELLTYKNAICNKECAEVWGESERLKEENKRAKTLLKATYDLLKKCDDSYHVKDVLGEKVMYDNAECDGICLMEDIESFLTEE